MKKESKYFENGKVYRFNPIRLIMFPLDIRVAKYTGKAMWELNIPEKFMYKGCSSDSVKFGCLKVLRVWCEEVK